MYRAVAEFMIAEHAATGNDHLELVGLVEVRPGDGARTLLDQEGHRVQRIVGRRILVRRQGVAVGADIGGVPAGRRLASAGAAGENAVGGQDHGGLPVLLSAAGVTEHFSLIRHVGLTQRRGEPLHAALATALLLPPRSMFWHAACRFPAAVSRNVALGAIL